MSQKDPDIRGASREIVGEGELSSEIKIELVKQYRFSMNFNSIWRNISKMRETFESLHRSSTSSSEDSKVTEEGDDDDDDLLKRLSIQRFMDLGQICILSCR